MTDLLHTQVAQSRHDERLHRADERRRAVRAARPAEARDAHRMQRALVRASVLLLPDRDEAPTRS